MASNCRPDVRPTGPPLVYIGPPEAGQVVREYPGPRYWAVQRAGPHPEDAGRTAVVLSGEGGELRRDAPHRHAWRDGGAPG